MLRRGLGGEPGTLDPQLADDTFALEVLRDLYEGLTVTDPSGSAVPGVAESWTVDSTGTRFTFKLRHEARWSDGKRVTADEFVRGLQRTLDPAVASPGADLLRVIRNADAVLAGTVPPGALGVTAPDAETLIIDLARPAPYLPDLLSNSVAYPLHGNASASSGPGANDRGTITNGPYTLAERRIGSHLTLRRNPHYWRATTVSISEVRFFPIADENVEFLRFRAGEIDVTNNIPSQRWDELRADRRVQAQVRPRLATAFYSFNFEHVPVARQRALRQAMSMVIDREALASRILKTGQVPAFSLVPPGVLNHEPMRYDWAEVSQQARVAEARQLLKQSGMVDDPPRIRLLYNENDLVRSVSLALAATWKETLGIETELLQEEYRVFLASRSDRSRWDVIRIGWAADYNDAASFLEPFRSDSPQNHGAWKSASFDALIDQAAHEFDVVKRRALLERAERLLLDDYAVLPLYFLVSKRVVQPWVKAPPLDPMGRNHSRHFSFMPATR